MFKGDWGLKQKGCGGVCIDGSEGAAGEQEEGHQWVETLSSVKVPKVKRVSVKLTPVFPFRAQVKRPSYVTVGELTAPPVSTFSSVTMDLGCCNR